MGGPDVPLEAIPLHPVAAGANEVERAFARLEQEVLHHVFQAHPGKDLGKLLATQREASRTEEAMAFRKPSPAPSARNGPYNVCPRISIRAAGNREVSVPPSAATC